MCWEECCLYPKVIRTKANVTVLSRIHAMECIGCLTLPGRLCWTAFLLTFLFWREIILFPCRSNASQVSCNRLAMNSACYTTGGTAQCFVSRRRKRVGKQARGEPPRELATTYTYAVMSVSKSRSSISSISSSNNSGSGGRISVPIVRGFSVVVRNHLSLPTDLRAFAPCRRVNAVSEPALYRPRVVIPPIGWWDLRPHRSIRSQGNTTCLQLARFLRCNVMIDAKSSGIEEWLRIDKYRACK